MKYLALVALLALGGCTVDNDDGGLHDNATDQTDSATGLTLKAGMNIYASFSQVVQYYNETMACMGMGVDPEMGPEVNFVSFDTHFDGRLGQPWAIWVFGGVIFVNTDVIGPSFPRDLRTDREALKHEYVHHILWANGADWHHGDPMFALCGAGVNTYN